MKRIMALLLIVGVLTFGASYATTMVLAGQGGDCCGQCSSSAG